VKCRCGLEAEVRLINVSDIFWFCPKGHVTTKSLQDW